MHFVPNIHQYQIIHELITKLTWIIKTLPGGKIGLPGGSSRLVTHQQNNIP